jgi:translation initiation factor 3 subunit E
MEEHDLTRQLSPYLDRHMVFPLLEYLDTLISKKAISYETKDVAEARLALLMPSTHMVDYAIDVYRSIHGENAIIPTEMEQHKQTVLEKRETLRQACAGLEQLRNDDEQRVRKNTTATARTNENQPD